MPRVQSSDVVEGGSHLGCQGLADLAHDLASLGRGDVPEVCVRLTRLAQRVVQLFRRSLPRRDAIRTVSTPSTYIRHPRRPSSCGARTDLTLASTSPVVGQTLSSTLPEPFHSPSYTPSSSCPVVGISRAESTADALLESCRRAAAASSAPWRVPALFRASINMASQCSTLFLRVLYGVDGSVGG